MTQGQGITSSAVVRANLNERLSVVKYLTRGQLLCAGGLRARASFAGLLESNLCATKIERQVSAQGHWRPLGKFRDSVRANPE